MRSLSPLAMHFRSNLYDQLQVALHENRQGRVNKALLFFSNFPNHFNFYSNDQCSRATAGGPAGLYVAIGVEFFRRILKAK